MQRFKGEIKKIKNQKTKCNVVIEGLSPNRAPVFRRDALWSRCLVGGPCPDGCGGGVSPRMEPPTCLPARHVYHALLFGSCLPPPHSFYPPFLKHYKSNGLKCKASKILKPSSIINCDSKFHL